jgi:hypothetical protein
MIKLRRNNKNQLVSTQCYQKNHFHFGGCQNTTGECECDCHLVIRCPACKSDDVQKLGNDDCVCRECNHKFKYLKPN